MTFLHYTTEKFKKLRLKSSKVMQLLDKNLNDLIVISVLFFVRFVCLYSRQLSMGSLFAFNPLLDDKFLDSSKLKEFADDNFKFDENSRKLSKRVENTVGKGEIARYEEFLLFPQCFQKACFPGASKSVIVWQWVN